MKKYITPAMQVNETQANQIIATSLALNTTTEVDGSDALAKEDFGDWDIWK